MKSHVKSNSQSRAVGRATLRTILRSPALKARVDGMQYCLKLKIGMDLTANELRCAHHPVFISSEYQVDRRLHFNKLQNAEILLTIVNFHHW